MNLRRTILTAAGLFILYNALLSGRCLNRFWVGAPNQWIRNDLAAQQFIYAKKLPQFVITGSSLSQRLFIARQDTQNLSMAGSSAFQGIEVVRKSKRYPAFILVESNTLLNGLDQAMIDRVFDPVMEPVRRRIFSQRIQNQPANYLMYPFVLAFIRWQGPAIPEKALRITETQEAGPGAPLIGAQATQTGSGVVSQSYRDMFADRARLAELKDACGRLAEIETELAANKSRLVYFRQPIHPELEASPRFQEENNLIDRWLAGRARIDHFKPAGLGFSDGYHLDADSARVYSGYLEENIARLAGER